MPNPRGSGGNGIPRGIIVRPFNYFNKMPFQRFNQYKGGKLKGQEGEGG